MTTPEDVRNPNPALTAGDPGTIPGRLFAMLRTAEIESWDTYVRHPFTARMADGSLPRESYLRYLRQDYVFLIHFSRAWAFGVAKSDRIGEMRAMTATLNALINEEIELHIATCAREGITEAELAATEELPATFAYTRFVTDAGLKGDLLDLLVALAPCVMGYGEIGTRLAAETGGPADGHPYADWIGTYAGAEYGEVCEGAEALMQAVARRTLGPDHAASPRWDDLRRLFRGACRLEADFWEMGLHG
ncbi:MAG: TenA family protein [Pseudomonadota bacterium]